MILPDTLAERLADERLAVLGAFHPDAGDGVAEGVQTLLMLGCAEPGFWPHLTASPEWQDGAPDPVDRWSRRVIGRMACDFGAKAYFPFGGPPYHPFYRWALKTGRIWDSPVMLLVSADQGLMVSFRGAIGLRERLELPPAPPKPCDTCAAPCLTACPAGAIAAGKYDVPACHAWLDRPKGADCLSSGCITRRACPLSQGYARLPEQSAYHMARFHGAAKS